MEITASALKIGEVAKMRRLTLDNIFAKPITKAYNHLHQIYDILYILNLRNIPTFIPHFWGFGPS